MGNVLNNGYGLFIPTFTLDGSTKIFQTVMMFQNTGAASAAANNGAIRSQLTGTGDLFHAAQMWTGFTFARSEVYVQIGTVKTYDINETAVIGTKAGSSSTPINTSILVKKNTGIVGKRYRGRFMFPNLWLNELDVSQAGIISGAGLTTLQGQMTSLLNDMTTIGTPLVLGHSVSEVAPTAILNLLVQTKVGTMGRRIRGF